MGKSKVKCKLCGEFFGDKEMSEEHYPARSVGNEDIVALDLVKLFDSFQSEEIRERIRNKLSTGESFEQIAVNASEVGDTLKFVKENETVKVCSYNGSVFAIEPPLFVELEITETEPGFAGNTAQGATKPATVETGAVVYVPLFVNQGDVIKIDTRTGEYLSRV